MNLNPKLVATDLDGTILFPDETASERTIEAIRALTSKGIAVSVCTARSSRSAVPLARRLGLTEGFAICGSGSTVYDIGADKMVHRNLFPLRLAQTLIGNLRESIPGVAFSAETGTAWARETHYLTTLATPWDAVEIEDALHVLDEETTKVNVRHASLDDSDLFAAVTEAVAELGLSHVISAAGFVEVLGPGIDKAAGVAWVADALGCDATDVIAFGDDRPDVPMLAWAGEGIAVANAHPEVLGIADQVCPSIEDDGVAQILETLHQVT